MTAPAFKDILRNGLWKQNPGVAQLLGLCPLLAISNSAVNALSLGLATTLVMTLSGCGVAAIREFIPNETRIPVYILLIAVLVTIVQFLMNAYVYPLYVVLGIFIPLIVTNCIVLARVEAFAAKNEPIGSTLDGIAMGAGLTLVLAVLGALREMVGNGTLFSGIEMVIPGSHEFTLFGADYPGFLVAVLPPGAFITLGFLIAGRNWLEARQQRRARQQPPTAPQAEDDTAVEPA